MAVAMNHLCRSTARFLGGGNKFTATSSLLNKQAVRFMHSEEETGVYNDGYLSPFGQDECYDIHQEPWLRSGPQIMKGNHSDYLIIGGGIMGQAVAYNLWRRLEQLTVVKATKYMASTITIIEKDPTLHESSTTLSVGGIRQQFSQGPNIGLSMTSAEFIRDIHTHLSTVEHQDVDVQYQPQGYLMLATEAGSQQLMKNYDVQTEAGAKMMLFTKDHLKETFPWLKCDDIELAAYGLENEGWFDPSMYVNAFKKKAPSLGIRSIKGEVVGFKKEDLTEFGKQPLNVPMEDGSTHQLDARLDGVYVKTPDHDKPIYIKTGNIINCAGPLSGQMSKLAGIGDKTSTNPLLTYELPVERRKRYVYVVHCPDAPMLDFPFLCDPSGFYIRREGFGGRYVCGMGPLSEEDEPDTSNLDVDEDFFYEEIWPRLAERVPVFEKLKLTSSWAGYYDYNTFDQNAVIGSHPLHQNFWFCTGFSGHGIQQAYGAAQSLSGLVVNGESPHCDVDAFSFQRFIQNKPFVEKNII